MAATIRVLGPGRRMGADRGGVRATARWPRRFSRPRAPPPAPPRPHARPDHPRRRLDDRFHGQACPGARHPDRKVSIVTEAVTWPARPAPRAPARARPDPRDAALGPIATSRRTSSRDSSSRSSSSRRAAEASDDDRAAWTRSSLRSSTRSIPGSAASSWRWRGVGVTTISAPSGASTRAISPPLRGANTFRARSAARSCSGSSPPDVAGHCRHPGMGAGGAAQGRRGGVEREAPPGQARVEQPRQLVAGARTGPGRSPA